MNVIFKDKDLEELILHGTSKKYKVLSKRAGFIDRLVGIYDIMTAAQDAKELYNYSWLHYEALKHEYTGYNSVRIKNGWVERLIVKETDGGITIEMIEINTNHYGNKK